MQTRHILGLDIGANSIGWAVVECQPSTLAPIRLIDLNSHIFQEAVDEKKKVPFNAIRREKRLMRRQIARRASHRQELVKTLQRSGFLPPVWDAAAANAVDRSFARRLLLDSSAKQFIGKADEKTLASPFAIRAYALDAKLEEHEFGRMILHLHRRRGFRSNRGAKYLDLLSKLKKSDIAVEAADEAGGVEQREKEVGKILRGIPQLAEEMKKSGARAVGEHVWKAARESNAAPARITTFSVHFAEVKREERGETPAGVEKIELYAKREMTENEFDAVCAAQMELRLAGLDNAVLSKIRESVFRQDPVQSPPPPARRLRHLRYNAVGNCALEPGRRRAAKAALVSQEFRTRAVINNIQMDDGQNPSAEQRDKLFIACQDPAQLNRNGRLSWTKVANILDGEKPNYDRGDPDAKTGLMGNRTFFALAEAMGGGEWARISADAENLSRITEDILTITDKLALYNRLVRRWKFSPGQDGSAFKLATLELEGGYMRYSLRAMRRMLPHLKDGMSEHDAREKAGYANPKAVRSGDLAKGPGDPAKEWLPQKAIPETANPRVQRALFAVRRVVNAVARKWGTPAAIRVEMPRDMKASKKHRSQIEKQQGENRKINVRAKDQLVELGWAPDKISWEDCEKYKMWKFEQNCQCPYCGQQIKDPMSESAEVDHIIPQSAFRQSYMNKVVVHRGCNRGEDGKNQRTPWQAWRGSSDRWNVIAKLADLKNPGMPGMPKEKRRRILSKREDFLSEEKFCERALRDTQHISTLTHGFLSATNIPVQVSRGQATAILRREWGLGNILPRHPESSKLPAKNRRDHRHHAVDAFVVALTDVKTLQRLIKHCQEREKIGQKNRPDPFFPPESWQGNISGQVRARLNAKVVSHQKNSKVRGALHKDMIYRRDFFIKPEPWQPNARGRKRIDELLGVDENIRRPGLNGDIDEDGKIEWIADPELCGAFAKWRTQSPGTPPPGGDAIVEIPVAHRFYSVRRSVEEALKRANGDWRPGVGGKKGWIVDMGMHKTLREWMDKHGFSSGTEKEIAQKIKEAPPETPARKAKRGNLIRTVRIGMMKSGVKTLAPRARRNRPAPPSRSVELRNNHHLEIFHKDGERELRMVSMLEAARRKQRQDPIINQNPNLEWGNGWNFQCSLAQGDLVVFNREEVDERIRGILEAHDSVFQSAVYRVQKISFADRKLQVAFRHHAVSGTDDKDTHGLISVTSLKNLACWKKEVGVLGADFSALER